MKKLLTIIPNFSTMLDNSSQYMYCKCSRECTKITLLLNLIKICNVCHSSFDRQAQLHRIYCTCNITAEKTEWK